MTRSVNEQHMIATGDWTLLPQNQETSRNASVVENIERERDDSINQSCIQQSFPDKVFVISLATLHLGVAVFVELTCLLIDFGLPAEEHALRANDTSSAIISERSNDVENESVVTVARGRRFETSASTKTAKEILESFLAEDLLLEFVFLR